MKTNILLVLLVLFTISSCSQNEENNENTNENSSVILSEGQGCINYGDYDCSPASPNGFCQGTGDVITYNALPWSSEWYYITTDKWISFGFLNPLPIDNPDSCLILGGCGMFPSQDNQCVIDKVNDDRILESNFIAGRKCMQNCNENDAFHSYTAGAPNNSMHPEYKLSITETLTIGDRIRVIVYAHNTAASGNPTIDTKIVLNWNENDKKIDSYISYQIENGGDYQNSNTATLDIPNLGSNLKFTPISLSRLNSNSAVPAYEVSNLTPNSTNFTVDVSTKTAIYTIGSQNSTLSDRKYVYIDFEIEEN